MESKNKQSKNDSCTYIRRCKEGWNPELKIQAIFPQQRNPKKNPSITSIAEITIKDI